MEIIESEKFILLKPNSNSFNEFLSKFESKANFFKNNHIIIDFSENINTKSPNLYVLLPYSERHKQLGTSFVIIFNDEFADDLLEKMDIVPTFTEAKDIIEMDAISRDLGF